MTLRLKITALLVCVITLSVACSYGTERLVVIPSFLALEQEGAKEDWKRCENAIERESDTLSSLCFDWASWDDAYSFVRDTNPAFRDANLKNPSWFVDQYCWLAMNEMGGSLSFCAAQHGRGASFRLELQVLTAEEHVAS